MGGRRVVGRIGRAERRLRRRSAVVLERSGC